MLAWHWVAENGKLRNGSPLRDGIYRHDDGELKLCESGLHASVKALDALRYAPGPIVCRVECRGEIVHDTDKLVCSEREVLWHRDATFELRSFARWCASQVLHLWEAPEVVRQYLETGDELIRAAAGAAARAAARDAARDAAGDAAGDAAWDAAWAAARDAAGDAAWDAQKAELEKRLCVLEKHVRV
jgi:hypothetical protein